MVTQFYWNEFTTLSCSPIIRVAFQQMQASNFLERRFSSVGKLGREEIYRN